MLSEAEKKWLHRRKNLDDHTFCWHCPTGKKGFPCTDWLYHLCPTQCSNQDFEDAAKFEARVAIELTRCHDDLTGCNGFDGTCHEETLTCLACRLKHARLAVEAEMES